jgi:hypothetical protein
MPADKLTDYAEAMKKVITAVESLDEAGLAKIIGALREFERHFAETPIFDLIPESSAGSTSMRHLSEPVSLPVVAWGRIDSIVVGAARYLVESSATPSAAGMRADSLTLDPAALERAAASAAGMAAVSPLHSLPGTFKPVDAKLIRDLHAKIMAEKLKPAPNIGLINVLSAFIYTYEQMNLHRASYKLIHHNPRHGGEMAIDVPALTQKRIAEGKTEFSACTLLLMLSALFHDIIFTGNRVNDEQKSAERLIDVLRVVLDKLSVEQKDIITNLIYCYIVGGTTPAFCCGAPMSTVSKLCDELLALRSDPVIGRPVYPLILDSTSDMHAADVSRNSEAFLYAGKDPFTTGNWTPLLDSFASYDVDMQAKLKRALAQSMRVVLEMWASKNADSKFPATVIHDMKRLTVYAANTQSGISADFVVTDLMVQTLAEAILPGEIGFARKQAEREPTQHWAQHADVMQNLRDKLIDPMQSLAEKQAIVKAFADITADQDGKLLTADSISAFAVELLVRPQPQMAVARVTSVSQATQTNVGAGVNCSCWAWCGW